MKPRPPENELLERILLLVVDHAGVKENEVRASSSLIRDLGIDSLDLIELLMAIEEEFEIRLPETDEVNDPVYSETGNRNPADVSCVVVRCQCLPVAKGRCLGFRCVCPL